MGLNEGVESNSAKDELIFYRTVVIKNASFDSDKWPSCNPLAIMCSEPLSMESERVPAEHQTARLIASL
jgi:hypothetical protein